MTIEALSLASQEELLKVPEIGPKVAHSIQTWFANPELKNEIEALQKAGVQIESGSKRNQEGPLSGLCFLITGTLPVSRDEAKDHIERNGGKMLSSVSSKLNYLVVGSDPGSKLKKAQDLGVTILDWDQLLNLLKK